MLLTIYFSSVSLIREDYKNTKYYFFKFNFRKTIDTLSFFSKLNAYGKYFRRSETRKEDISDKV